MGRHAAEHEGPECKQPPLRVLVPDQLSPQREEQRHARHGHQEVSPEEQWWATMPVTRGFDGHADHEQRRRERQDVSGIGAVRLLQRRAADLGFVTGTRQHVVSHGWFPSRLSSIRRRRRRDSLREATWQKMFRQDHAARLLQAGPSLASDFRQAGRISFAARNPLR